MSIGHASSSDLYPVEHELSELTRRSTGHEAGNLKGSGEILDEGMVSDLLSGVL